MITIFTRTSETNTRIFRTNSTLYLPRAIKHTNSSSRHSKSPSGRSFSRFPDGMSLRIPLGIGGSVSMALSVRMSHLKQNKEKRIDPLSFLNQQKTLCNHISFNQLQMSDLRCTRVYRKIWTSRNAAVYLSEGFRDFTTFIRGRLALV